MSLGLTLASQGACMLNTSTIFFSQALYMWLSLIMLVFFFFFSSRRRHTRFDCDWSSDVCSSDLGRVVGDPPKKRGFLADRDGGVRRRDDVETRRHRPVGAAFRLAGVVRREHERSEERRVGKECRSRWSPYH